MTGKLKSSRPPEGAKQSYDEWAAAQRRNHENLAAMIEAGPATGVVHGKPTRRGPDGKIYKVFDDSPKQEKAKEPEDDDTSREDNACGSSS